MPRSKSPNLHGKQDKPTIGPSGRVEMTIDQLPVEARTRLENAEKWVAWEPDYQSIIASGLTHEQVREAARIAGHPHASMEWVTPVPGRIWE